MGTVYLDTSAIAKLIVPEPETTALRAFLNALPEAPVSSDLARTETLRAARRTDPALVARARQVLDRLDLITAPPGIFEAAARLEPPELRSLDAIHLATALDLGDDLDALVTYDRQLASAARGYGLTVLEPGSRGSGQADERAGRDGEAAG